MGQCVSSSVDKNPDSVNKSHQLFRPCLEGFPISSPVKDKSQGVEFTKFDQISKTNSYSFGSKEEAFYDTQPWLDSDCDEDFYSVNGDFTPSRGNTPVHHSFSSSQRRLSPYWNSTLTSPSPGRTPNARKKSLSDLFEESGRFVTENTEQDILSTSNAEMMHSKQTGRGESLPSSAIGSPYISGAHLIYRGQKTPKEDIVMRKVRSFKSVKCCLPQLLSSQSFDERKRSVTLMSPPEKNE